MALSADQIKNKKDIKVESISVPEWGGEVFVRSMTGTQRDAFDRQAIDKKLQRAVVAAWCVCDVDGSRLFKDEDAKWLGDKNGYVLERVFDKALDLSGLGSASEDTAEKNLPAGRNGDSGSGSQPSLAAAP